MTDTELGDAIHESRRYRIIVQNEIMRRFPIGSRARMKVSGDIVRVHSTSMVVGNLIVSTQDRLSPFDVLCFDLEPINESPPET